MTTADIVLNMQITIANHMKQEWNIDAIEEAIYVGDKK